MNYFAETFTKLNNGIDSAVVTMLDYSPQIKGIIFSGWMLYLVYQAFRYLHGNITAFKEVSEEFLRVTLVCSFAFGGDYYLTSIVPFIRDAGSELSSYIVGGDGVTNSLDALLTAGVGIVSSVTKHMSITDLSLSFMIILYVLMTGSGLLLFMFAGLLLLVTVKMTGAILAVSGLLFIAFALFPLTRGYFFAWISQVMNVILLEVFFAITIKIALGVIEFILLGAVDASMGTLLANGAFLFIFLCVVGTFITSLGDISAAITGGASLGRGGINSVKSGIAGTAGSIKGAINGSKTIKNGVGRLFGGSNGIGK